jgi:hypothetical protein
MRTTKICPKCGSNDVVIVPGRVGGTFAGNHVQVGFLGLPVEVARYLCCECGFSEEWVDNPEDLERIKKKYGEK